MPPKAGHFAAALRLPMAPCSGSCTQELMPSTKLPEVLVGFGHHQKHLVSNKHLERILCWGEVFKLLIFSQREGVWYTRRVASSLVASPGCSPPTMHTPGRGGKEELLPSGLAAFPSSNPTGGAATIPQVQPPGRGPSCAFPVQESSLSFSAAVIPPHPLFLSCSDPSLSSQLLFKKGRGSGFSQGQLFGVHEDRTLRALGEFA